MHSHMRMQFRSHFRIVWDGGHVFMKAALTSVRLVAIFEAFKGLVVILAGFGLLSMIHADAEQVAERLVHHLHLDAARHYPRIFIEAARQLNDVHLWWLALAAAIYASIRFAEAAGLWFEKAWAEWLAAISGAIYLPFEIYELSRGFTWLRLTTFIGNVLVVAVMIYALRARRFDAPR